MPKFERTPEAVSNAACLLRELSIEQCKLSSLSKNRRNARTHSKRQIQAIADSIRAFGFANPILIDENGLILAGTGRAAAAELLGLQSVPTIKIADLSEAQQRAFILAENKLAQRAGWDRELLALELGELSIQLPDLGFSVELTGFENGEVEAILTDVEETRREAVMMRSFRHPVIPSAV